VKTALKSVDFCRDYKQKKLALFMAHVLCYSHIWSSFETWTIWFARL